MSWVFQNSSTASTAPRLTDSVSATWSSESALTSSRPMTSSDIAHLRNQVVGDARRRRVPEYSDAHELRQDLHEHSGTPQNTDCPRTRSADEPVHIDDRLSPNTTTCGDLHDHARSQSSEQHRCVSQLGDRVIRFAEIVAQVFEHLGGHVPHRDQAG